MWVFSHKHQGTKDAEKGFRKEIIKVNMMTNLGCQLEYLGGGIFVGEFPSSRWPVGMTMWHFLDC